MRPLRSNLVTLALAAAIACAAPLLATADGDETEQDAARDAVEQGSVRPLADILSRPEVVAMGDVVRVKLKRDHGRWLYDLRTIDREGHLREIEVDAATGSLAREEED